MSSLKNGLINLYSSDGFSAISVSDQSNNAIHILPYNTNIGEDVNSIYSLLLNNFIQNENPNLEVLKRVEGKMYHNID
jgi:hypothetical protein